MRYDLKDTTFLIYLRIDSYDRLLNLNIVIGHIEKHFNTNIHLLEVDDSAKIENQIINRESLTYVFVEDRDVIFHTTKYRNLMIRQCKTPYFYVCDTDVIAAPEALLKSILLLRKTTYKILVYPYNGDFINVPLAIRDIYSKSLDYELLEKRKDEFNLWFNNSVGGIFGGHTSIFKENNSDNEKIFGWGPDDKERYYRLKKAGFKIIRFNFPLYHLFHKRNIYSKPADATNNSKNILEYFKTFNSDL